MIAYLILLLDKLKFDYSFGTIDSIKCSTIMMQNYDWMIRCKKFSLNFPKINYTLNKINNKKFAKAIIKSIIR